MRNKMYKAMSIMAVTGLMLTSCTSNDAPKNGETPQEENVDLTGFPELNPIKTNLKFHETFAYKAPDGTARRASMTIQEYPNGGYVEKKVKAGFAEELADANDGKPASSTAIDKETQKFLKEQREESVFYARNFAVEKIGGAEEERVDETDNRVYILTDQPCRTATSSSTPDPLYNIPYESGCLVSEKTTFLRDREFRQASVKWEKPNPFDYGNPDLRTRTVTTASGGVVFEAKGTDQDKARSIKQVFAVYDLESGGEPIETLPNFTCEPGSAGQAIMDAFKAESDAEGGIAKRYMMFAPSDSGCTMQPVPSASESS